MKIEQSKEFSRAWGVADRLDSILVGDHHSMNCCVFWSCHQVFFFSSSSTMFSTKSLDFFISSRQLIDMLISSSVDPSNKDWQGSFSNLQNLPGQLLDARGEVDSFCCNFSCWIEPIGRIPTICHVPANRKVSRSNQFLSKNKRCSFVCSTMKDVVHMGVIVLEWFLAPEVRRDEQSIAQSIWDELVDDEGILCGEGS